MVIKRFSNMLGSRHGANPFSRNRSSDMAEPDAPVNHSEGSPESNAVRAMKAFCESGGPNTQGEEVLHLPTIVDAAESSPAAAQVAAQQIRKYLSKDNYARPHVQYNAIMLIRILADNPGATFTRNLDQKFTATIKELLRNNRDGSVQQSIRETLQTLYLEKAYDTNLAALFAMWSKESGMSISQSARAGGAGQHAGQGRHGQSQVPRTYSDNSARGAGLPAPSELAARIEEAKTSAKLLQQLVQSTPASELQDNDLVREFAERCQNAQRSMHGFMNCQNPSPDDETMQTLIETSEQLSLAASKHQRAVLQARKAGHVARFPAPAPAPPPQPENGYTPPSGPPPSQNTGYSNPNAAPSSTFQPTATHNLSSYSPPPIPSTIRDTFRRRSTAEDFLSAAPPSLKPSGPPRLPRVTTNTNDDPFADDADVYPSSRGAPHTNRMSMEPVSASSYGSDDPYNDPYRTTHPAASIIAARNSQPAPAPVSTAPAGPQPSWRDSKPRSPEPYSPGYTSTSSYVRRRESGGDHLTMHSAASSPTSRDAVPEERVTESAGRYGRTSPEETRDQAGEGRGDVSPLESRHAPAADQTGYRY